MDEQIEMKNKFYKEKADTKYNCYPPIIIESKKKRPPQICIDSQQVRMENEPRRVFLRCPPLQWTYLTDDDQTERSKTQN